MTRRWLIPLGAVLSISLLANGQERWPQNDKPRSSTDQAPYGYLLPHNGTPGNESLQALPYRPQPGDLVLYDAHSKFFHAVYRLARTGSPIHSAIVIARDDGSPALLELTGPTIVSAKVVIIDLLPRMSTYPGDVMVRLLREPLTPEQSRDMTQFGQSQVGRGFALHRCMLLGTPFCPKLGIRRACFGRTYFNRHRWFCSEMVVAAGTTAHLFDPHMHPANATRPRDLAFDETMDLSALYHPVQPWTADRPPATPIIAIPMLKNRQGR